MGLISLAVVLTALLSIGIPISVSKDSVELKDWLGFAGNIIGAAATLAAAYVAWRAVQRQIAAQRNAMLLDITTREEDRLESELHAISVILEFALKARQASRNAGHYVAALEELGISGNEIATREFLQKKLPGPIPPLLLSEFASVFTELIIAARRSEAAFASDADTRAVLRGALTFWQQKLLSLSSQTVQREKLIQDKLLPAYRKRIESGLLALHD